MTKSQTARYWRDWSRCRKILTELGEFSPADADAQRKVIQREAIGAEKSSKDLTNADLDKVFRAFGKILVLADGPRKGPEEDQPVKRLIYAIEQLGVPEPYLQKICRDQYGTSDWRQLPEDKLTKFRMTATARAKAFKK